MSKRPPIVEKRPLAPIENIVFEGGGVKGLAYAGALKVLKERGMLDGIKRVGGSSAGGITAMLLGLGYTVEEIAKEMGDMDFTKFQDAAGKEFWRNIPKKLGQDSAKKIEEFLKVIRSERHGLYKGDIFLQWVRAKVAEKLGNPDATFRDLEKAMKVDPTLRDMMFTASNISGNAFALQYFDSRNTPDVRIADAVRATMSYPGAFEAYPIKIKGVESVFVDGGLVNNFPIKYYDQERFLEKNAKGEGGRNLKTIGFRVDSPAEMMYKWRERDLTEEDFRRNEEDKKRQTAKSESEIAAKKKIALTKPGKGKNSHQTLTHSLISNKKSIEDSPVRKKETKSFLGYIRGMVGALTSDRALVHERGFDIIQIPTDISTLKFELTAEDKKQLINKGMEKTDEYMDNYRKFAYEEYDKRIFYETLSGEELLEKKEALEEAREDLEELLENMQARQPSESIQKIVLLQKNIQAMKQEIDLIDSVLIYKTLGKQKTVLEDVEHLLSVQMEYASKTQGELKTILENLETLRKSIVDVKTKQDDYYEVIAHFQPEMKALLDETFTKVEVLYRQLTKLLREINIRKSQGATGEILSGLRGRLVDEWRKTNKEIKANLHKVMLDTHGNKKDKDVAMDLINIELSKIANMDVIPASHPPRNFNEFRLHFEKNKKRLDKNMKEFVLSIKLAQQEMTKNTAELQKLEQTRRAIGRNPSKMFNLATDLTKFINKQNSLGNWLYQKLLLNVVAPFVSGSIQILGWALPAKILEKMKGYQKTLYDDYEVYQKKAVQLRDNIMVLLKEKSDNQDSQTVRKKVDDYEKALEEITKLGPTNPFSRIQNEVLSLVKPESIRIGVEQFAYKAHMTEKERNNHHRKDNEDHKPKPSAT